MEQPKWTFRIARKRVAQPAIFSDSSVGTFALKTGMFQSPRRSEENGAKAQRPHLGAEAVHRGHFEDRALADRALADRALCAILDSDSENEPSHAAAKNGTTSAALVKLKPFPQA